jgi:hypothetical protein
VAGAQLLLKLVQSVRKEDMKILCEGIGLDSKDFGVEVPK